MSAIEYDYDNRELKAHRSLSSSISKIEPTVEEEDIVKKYGSNAWMDNLSKVVLLREVRKAKTYFEFGCGGSTVFACQT